MRKWNTADDLILVDRLVEALRSGRGLRPGGAFAGDPVDLRGLAFPNATLCGRFELPDANVARISGRQEFTSAALRRVDMSKAKLDHSVWNKCGFSQVAFDSARLTGARFFGCAFTDCSFDRTALNDASFSVARDGAETEFDGCAFTKVNFKGVSNHNLVLKSVRFVDCKLDGFVFEQPLCQNVEFRGKYKELTFRGTPRDVDRNRLGLNLSEARLVWLHADDGLDLTQVVLPNDGSCFVVVNRETVIERMCDRLVNAMPKAMPLAKILRGIYTKRSISPLSANQVTVLMSLGMIRELDDKLTEDQVIQAYRILKSEAC